MMFTILAWTMPRQLPGVTWSTFDTRQGLPSWTITMPALIWVAAITELSPQCWEIGGSRLVYATHLRGATGWRRTSRGRAGAGSVPGHASLHGGAHGPRTHPPRHRDRLLDRGARGSHR